MVFQRNVPITIWGKSAPGNHINILFSGNYKNVVTRVDSTWNVEFQPLPATKEPQKLEIWSKHEKIVLDNILIGDVWLLSGQSNMEYPLGSEAHFAKEQEQLVDGRLRYFNANYIGKGIYGEKYTREALNKLNAQEYFTGTWQESQLPEVKELSAVGYYFGKKIITETGVPIGLINIAIGGAPIETFISVNRLKNSKVFRKKVQGNWLYNDALPVWIRQRGMENVRNSFIYKDSLGPNHSYKPGFAYEAMVKTLLPFPIKGIVWYQGESNAQEQERVEEYPALQKLMIQNYRSKWRQPKMPFYWVQLSSIDTINYDSHYWPPFRNNQRLLLKSIKHGGMVVSSDIGNQTNIHPSNKKDVGERLARWALNDCYGVKMITSGPLPVQAHYKNGKVIISFQYTGDGLKTMGNKKLLGFSINGKTPIPAIIHQDKVIIKVKEQPEYIFYGWQPFSTGNLYNSENLPASTFKLIVNP
ncbi:sialate O-acetylesterase [Christiangramia fulva]|nr:sialate O-acetylesterase [Christiangramia fulva]